MTPSWWTDLWLNEGFASYMGYIASQAVFPKFRMMEQFLLTFHHEALRLDALESSHPVSIPVKHPDEIGAIFDKISYGKGGSIVKMMEHFLTTKTFKQVSRIQFEKAILTTGSDQLPDNLLLPSGRSRQSLAPPHPTGPQGRYSSCRYQCQDHHGHMDLAERLPHSQPDKRLQLG